MYIDAIKISLTTFIYQARVIPCLKASLGFEDKPYSMKTDTQREKRLSFLLSLARAKK